jgi:hypothetical protein
VNVPCQLGFQTGGTVSVVLSRSCSSMLTSHSASATYSFESLQVYAGSSVYYMAEFLFCVLSSCCWQLIGCTFLQLQEEWICFSEVMRTKSHRCCAFCVTFWLRFFMKFAFDFTYQQIFHSDHFTVVWRGAVSNSIESTLLEFLAAKSPRELHFLIAHLGSIWWYIC